MPLNQQKIQQFLLSREITNGNEAKLKGDDYQTACENYLADVLQKDQNKALQAASLKVLSNPMDLTVIGQMLAQGKQPQIFNLREQQYKSMAADYEYTEGRKFPLFAFGLFCYHLRVNDQFYFDDTAFVQAGVINGANHLLHHKMLTLFHHDSSPQTADIPQMKYYRFRHDKIMDYFILDVFKGREVGQQKITKHLGDSRFSGVYLLLAMALDWGEALDLRETLLHYAADTKDHCVSDLYIQLVRDRQVNKLMSD